MVYRSFGLSSIFRSSICDRESVSVPLRNERPQTILPSSSFLREPRKSLPLYNPTEHTVYSRSSRTVYCRSCADFSLRARKFGRYTRREESNLSPKKQLELVAVPQCTQAEGSAISMFNQSHSCFRYNKHYLFVY